MGPGTPPEAQAPPATQARMQVGLALPQYDFSVPGQSPLQWSSVVAWACRAEALGFSSLWLSDHLFYDLARYGGPSRRQGGLDPLVALAGLARVTRRVSLGTLVLCAPLRPAAVLAKALACLDVVSDGRLIVGIGAGWYRDEMEEAKVVLGSPAQRMARLAESVQVLRGMFGGGPFSFAGTYERASGARCLPLPVQRPSPPIWIGGKGDRLLELVAAHGDGWNMAWTATPKALSQRLRVLDAACERLGRDPDSIQRSVGLYALVGENEADLTRRFERLRELSPRGVFVDAPTLAQWRVGRLVGTVDQVGEELAEWADLSVSTLIVNLGAVPFAVGHPDDVEMVAAGCRLAPPWPASDPLN